MRTIRARALPLLLGLAFATLAQAASHREAPFIAQDPTADNTDVYAFVSYDAANLARAANDRKVTFVLNVGPGQDPGDGPNYFGFNDSVGYQINIDHDADGKAEDVVYEVRFKTENRPIGGRGRPHVAGAAARQSPHHGARRPAAGHHRARRSRLRRPDAAADLHGDRDSRSQAHAAVLRPHARRGSVERRSGDDAELRGARRAGRLHRPGTGVRVFAG